MTSVPELWDHEVDLLVVGSGGGGMTAALAAHDCGLSALIVEKGKRYGGSTGISGGGIWIPLNYGQKTAGIKDDLETAFGYMKRCVRGMATDDRVLMTSVEGELFLLDAKADKFKLLSRLKVFADEKGVLSHPAFVGTRIYLRGNASIVCLDLKP